MNNNRTHVALLLEPRRVLRADFTAQTLHRAAVAKRRATNKQQMKAFFKEPFSMKSLKFLHTVPGAALVLAIIATTGVGAYAITNWFNGNVSVTQNDSVLSVDLSQCKGNLPPGVEPSSDRHNVQFKILDSSHISARDLQQQLLVECEFQAVLEFYRQAAPTADVGPATIKAVDGNVVSLAYSWGGTMHEKRFSLSPNATIYNQGATMRLQDLRAGDKVVFATPHREVQEGTDPLAAVNEVQSIFKTQYDTTQAFSTSKKGFYEDNHIMPLDWFNQINH